jgi:hypothetical protein
MHLHHSSICKPLPTLVFAAFSRSPLQNPRSLLFPALKPAPPSAWGCIAGFSTHIFPLYPRRRTSFDILVPTFLRNHTNLSVLQLTLATTIDRVRDLALLDDALEARIANLAGARTLLGADRIAGKIIAAAEIVRP